MMREVIASISMACSGGEESELWSGGLRGIAGVLGGGEQGGEVGGDPDRADASTALEEKITATDVFEHKVSRRTESLQGLYAAWK